MKEIIKGITHWNAPEVADEIKFGDMPGDKVILSEDVEKKARIIFPELLHRIHQLVDKDSEERVVVTVCGGSGVGKSGIASLISYYFKCLGINSYTLSGDNYPKRIPLYNDAERLRIYRTAGIQALLCRGEYTKERFEILHKLEEEGQDANLEYCKEYPWLNIYRNGGKEGLKSYLGTEQEIDFQELERIVTEFKSGKEKIWLKRMGRADTELWYEEVTFQKKGILLIEWTHGNSDYYNGVDIPILLCSTPQETLIYRKARSRDGATDSPFTTLVLEIEQNLLDSQAKKAQIILSKQAELLNFDQYKEYMKREGEETDEQ